MTVGEEIKKIRFKHNLTQVEFAEKVSLSDKSVSGAENGRFYPKIPTVERINKIFNCNIIHKNSLVGKKFGMLTVIAYEKADVNGDYKWKCKCECGNVNIVNGRALNTGMTKSCGCLQKENASNIVKVDMYQGTKIGLLSQKVRINNKSGYKGVSYDKQQEKWCARLTLGGKNMLRRYFKNKEDAIKARKEAEEKYFKPVIKEFKELQA